METLAIVLLCKFLLFKHVHLLGSGILSWPQGLQDHSI